MHSSIIFAAPLALLAAASPVARRQAPQPYEITGFTAAKGHLSGYCNYNFNVTAAGLAAPAECHAFVDAGFSGATWLAYVYQGIGNCSTDAVTWTFSDPQNGGDAHFNVTVNGVVGTYVVPEKDITVSLNDPANPFDNDVYYSGPKDFCIDTFPQA